MTATLALIAVMLVPSLVSPAAAAGPSIRDVRAYDIGPREAKITWTLDVPATGQVEYGTTTDYGQRTKLEESFDYSTHIQEITGLEPGTRYHFRVSSTDRDGAETVSGDFTFETRSEATPAPDPTPRPTARPTQAPTPRPTAVPGPVISGISTSDIGSDSATISWDVDMPATGQVEYGTTTDYGQRTKLEESFDHSTHIQQITGLEPGTLYHFRVRSTNEAGAEDVSGDRTFTTEAVRPAPTATPRPTTAPTPRPTPTATPRPTSPPTSGAYVVPDSIDSSGSTDVSAALQRFIAGVPNGSTIRFRSGTYRLDDGLNLSNRRDLVLDGNGATLRARGSASRPLDSIFSLMVGSQRLTFRNFTLIGNNPNAGTADALSGGENLHAFYIGGATDILVEDVTIRNFYGDCVYVGTDSGTTWSRNVTFQDSTCTGTGRHGVTIIAGRNTIIQRVTFDQIGFMVVDIEPNRSVEGAIGTIIRNNTVGSYALTDRYVGWFVAASAGASGAAVQDLTISGNAVNGVARSGYDGSALGISVVIDGRIGPRSGITIRDNTSTRTVSRTGHGAPILIRNATGVTITGNRQPMSSGAFASVSGSTSVTNSGNDTSQ